MAECEALRDLFQDELEEQYEAGEAKGLSKGKIEIIKNMYKNNFTIDQNALINFYEEPEYTQELIDYLTEWELEYAEKICKYLKPDAIFHHDDWGSQTSTFISPDMFEEFILPSYKKIYGYYKSHGVELIVHHSDSYAATLVPYMIDMGIDIWQGTMSSNNIPELIQKYGDQITIMGGIDSASVGLVMAYSGYGIWSLVFQQVGGYIIRTILLWILGRWKPKRKWSWECR